MQFDTTTAAGSGIPATLTVDDRCCPVAGTYIDWIDGAGAHHDARVTWVQFYPAAVGGSVGRLGCDSGAPPPPPPP